MSPTETELLLAKHLNDQSYGFSLNDWLTVAGATQWRIPPSHIHSVLSIPLREWDFATPSPAWICSEEEWLGEMEAARVNCALKYDGLEPGVLNTILYFQGQFRIQDVDKLKREFSNKGGGESREMSFWKITCVFTTGFTHVVPKNSYLLQSL